MPAVDFDPLLEWLITSGRCSATSSAAELVYALTVENLNYGEEPTHLRSNITAFRKLGQLVRLRKAEAFLLRRAGAA